MTLVIRPAVAGDEELILHFIAALADYEKLSHQVRATGANLTKYLFGPQPHAWCDIAEWEGQPAGFAFWFYNFSTFASRPGIYLEDLFVEPHLRGHGIGKALLANLARRAVAEGLCMVQWWVLNWNAPSIGFYQSIGAVPQDEWTVFRLTGEPMQKLAEGA
ncbi:MAG: GNAT family N-acetyltransferase [Alphaproteobacteria bacterium]|nr:GNAT family N-acetyltransferase [Alphaproteobacteria bacterium]